MILYSFKSSTYLGYRNNDWVAENIDEVAGLELGGGHGEYPGGAAVVDRLQGIPSPTLHYHIRAPLIISRT